LWKEGRWGLPNLTGKKTAAKPECGRGGDAQGEEEKTRKPATNNIGRGTREGTGDQKGDIP